ncbi:MAG: cation-translocating P-type ATPase [Candidatus Diapherotrites archaeon]|nr:cation-translocating P-type ATPase [Candidatus Diapherotrites archaeon]
MDTDSAYWHMDGKAVLNALGSTDTGLSGGTAQQRLAKFGRNELAKKRRSFLIDFLIGQVSDFLVLVLIVAALLLYFVIGERLDAAVIVAIVVLNAVVGFVQEYKAERAIEAIQQMDAHRCRVVRDGVVREIPATEVVPGDILRLEAGDRVSADGRLLECYSFLVDESSLTGESVGSEKSIGVLGESIPLGDRTNMVFKQTLVSNGKALVVVTGTGMDTEIGRIAGLLSEIESEDTPLVRRLKDASYKIGVFVGAVCTLLFVLGLLKGWTVVETAKIAISLAVAAVPEGLPAIITITLALGARALAKKNSIVRKMSAVETIGSCSVICSDKTGTLTKNEMTVTTFVCDGAVWTVTGSGFGTQGEFLSDGKKTDPTKNEELMSLLRAAALDNDAMLDGQKRLGDSTEIALLVAAKKAGLDPRAMASQAPIVDECPFDPTRKTMSVQVNENGQFEVLVKGSAEAMLSISTKMRENGRTVALSQAKKEEWLQKNDELALSGLRVLGFALKSAKTRFPKERMESDLVFLGLAGMYDPPRPEAKDAIGRCHRAGIEVKMITGDHPLTSLAVARELGLAKNEEDVVLGSALDALSPSEFETAVRSKIVFARVNPEHKMAIVRILQKQGHVVGMTGDGVNDAPALKQADVGFAMGITGTDVAKEAAQVVLADDNFATIVSGIEEGRRIYSNIRGFIQYLFAANLGEIIIVLGAVLLDFRFIPLLAIQILWLNLATDGFPALALGAEVGTKDHMNRPPRKSSEGLLDGMKTFILVAGIVSAIVTLSLFAWALGSGWSVEKARTMAFGVLVLFELVLVFSCRSENKTVFELPPWTNGRLVLAVGASLVLQVAITQLPFFHEIFRTASLNGAEWGLLVAGAATALLVPYIVRAIKGMAPARIRA